MSRGRVLGPAVLAAVAVLAVSSRPWVSTEVVTATGAALRLEPSGRDVAGLAPAAALVALAATLAAATARRVGRLVASALLALSGVAVAGAALAVLADPGASVRAAVAEATARTDATTPDATASAWPWTVVAAGVVLLGCGLVALVASRRWGTTARYDAAPPAAAPTASPARPVDPAVESAAGVQAPGREDAGADPAALWDALGRGEDPTSTRRAPGPDH